MMIRRSALLMFAALCLLFRMPAAQANESLLQAGPMPGYADMFEVKVWLQTREAHAVHLVYRDVQGGAEMQSETINTSRSTAFTALFVLDRLEPGRRYSYDVYVDGRKQDFEYATEFTTQKLWQYREDPPAFKVALGSCAFINDSTYDRPGKAYGGDYRIFESIVTKKPDVMVWLGDNVYFREPDWNTFSGMAYRYTHGRSIPEMQELLAACNHLAIWDDHDFGPNDSDGSFWNKETALEVFKLFWANPSYGFSNMPGVTSLAEWNDVDIFLLDNRYNRSPNKRKTGKRQILGDEQLEWLISALTFSDAPFKLVCIGGQVLNPVARYENYANYHEERARLLGEIEQNKISGVVFVSGDRHHSDISKMDRSGTYPLHELTVSPLTSGTYGISNEPNYFRLEGSSVGQRNFAVLSFSGPKEERVMDIHIYAADGTELVTHSIKASELR